MTETLRECPFCAYKAVCVMEDCYVYCPCCDAEGPVSITGEAEAITLWNTRKGDPA